MASLQIKMVYGMDNDRNALNPTIGHQERKNMLFFLMGFMGSGKSLLGRGAARKLGFRHVEMDDEIIKTTGMSINAIFEKKGESFFRDTERAVLDEIIYQTQGTYHPVVVSTGGGVPCYFDNMARMKSTGITIFVNPSQDVLVDRLEMKKEDRPLIRDRSKSEIREYVEKAMKERLSFYRQADITCNPIYDQKELNIDFMANLIRSASRHPGGILQ